MKIEAGKCYRTRDGRKVGPMAGNNEHFIWVEGKAAGKDPEWCPKTGKHRAGYGMTSQDDLIAEWQDEPETGTLQQLNVKPGDVVELVENGIIPGSGIGKTGTVIVENGRYRTTGGMTRGDSSGHVFRIISRASDAASFETRDDFIAAVASDAQPSASVSPDHSFDVGPKNPRVWSEMTPEEKGALLLAEHEGKVIERARYGVKQSATDSDKMVWHEFDLHDVLPSDVVRVRPEPKRETVADLWGDWGWSLGNKTPGATHRITFTTLDGKPDCASIKMEEL